MGNRWRQRDFNVYSMTIQCIPMRRTLEVEDQAWGQKMKASENGHQMAPNGFQCILSVYWCLLFQLGGQAVALGSTQSILFCIPVSYSNVYVFTIFILKTSLMYTYSTLPLYLMNTTFILNLTEYQQYTAHWISELCTAIRKVEIE